MHPNTSTTTTSSKKREGSMRFTPIKAARLASPASLSLTTERTSFGLAKKRQKQSRGAPGLYSPLRIIVFIGVGLLMTRIMMVEQRMLEKTRTLMVGEEMGYTRLLQSNENDEYQLRKLPSEAYPWVMPHHQHLRQQDEVVELDFFPRLPVRKTWEQQTTTTRQRPLNFVHIPKTGGSSIFVAAVKNGYAWADCLFPSSWSRNFCPEKSYRYPNGTGTASRLKVNWPRHQYGAPWWHIPVQYLPHNPYRNFDLFAVVRNPYERAVSEYYYHCQLHKRTCFGPKKENDSVPRMNSKIQNFVQRQLTASKNSSDYYAYWGHWIPQYDYLFNTTTKKHPSRIVAHLLHNEVLHEEFTSLVTAYGYNWTIPVHRHRSRQDLGAQLTAFNLTSTTMRWIERAYEQDFVLGGYEMLSKRVLAMERKANEKQAEAEEEQTMDSFHAGRGKKSLTNIIR